VHPATVKTDHNAAGQICTHAAGASLSELGREQTARLAERLRVRRVAVIYTSPLPRAAQTAEILPAGARSAPIGELTQAFGAQRYDTMGRKRWSGI